MSELGWGSWYKSWCDNPYTQMAINMKLLLRDEVEYTSATTTRHEDTTTTMSDFPFVTNELGHFLCDLALTYIYPSLLMFHVIVYCSSNVKGF